MYVPRISDTLNNIRECHWHMYLTGHYEYSFDEN
jgi:hypothetical protein